MVERAVMVGMGGVAEVEYLASSVFYKIDSVLENCKLSGVLSDNNSCRDTNPTSRIIY